MNPEEFVNVSKPKPPKSEPQDFATKAKVAQDGTSQPSATPAPTTAAPRPRAKKKKSLYDRLDISGYVSFDTVVRNLSFILFIALLALAYIWNNHYAMKSIKTINLNDKQVKQLKWEYLTAKSELEGKSKQSEVARLVDADNIHELKTPPVKIYVDQQRN